MSYSSNLARSAEGCGYGSDHPKVVGAREFADMVTSLMLCARLNTGSTRALKACARTLRNRMTQPSIIAMCEMVIKQPFPHGYVCKLDRLLRSVDAQVGKLLDETD